MLRKICRNMALENLKVVVFDLDYTLWPFWVDTHVSPPFRKTSNGQILDSQKTPIKCYPEVPRILEKLFNEGYKLAVASRTSEVKGARQLIELFGWDKYFSYLEIFPGCKTTHFNKIKNQSGVSFNQMIFFDDEQRNIRDISEIGVTSIFVKTGVNQEVIEEGKRKFLEQRK